MADKSKIEWTNATWNPVTGCSLVSPGCTNCYAMRLAGTRLKHHPSRAGLTTTGKAGPVWNGQVRFNEQWLDQPLRWKKPRRIRVWAHGDLFHEAVPDFWIDRVFAVMGLTPRHTYQVLTKRSGRMRDYMFRLARSINPLEDAAKALGYTFNFKGHSLLRWPLPNVWLGVSVEDQRRADERIPELLETPAAVRFLSCEPLLGPVDLYRGGFSFLHRIISPTGKNHERVDWVICGGESGPGARDMNPDWARSLRDQCEASGVPFFFKQMARKAPIPPDLMVREFPRSVSATQEKPNDRELQNDPEPAGSRSETTGHRPDRRARKARGRDSRGDRAAAGGGRR